jgi:hypothetical protein
MKMVSQFPPKRKLKLILRRKKENKPTKKWEIQQEGKGC